MDRSWDHEARTKSFELLVWNSSQLLAVDEVCYMLIEDSQKPEGRPEDMASLLVNACTESFLQGICKWGRARKIVPALSGLDNFLKMVSKLLPPLVKRRWGNPKLITY